MSKWTTLLVDDPKITVGNYRVLAMTDGRFVAYDERVHPTRNPVHIASTCDKIVAWCIARSPAGTEAVKT